MRLLSNPFIRLKKKQQPQAKIALFELQLMQPITALGKFSSASDDFQAPY